MKTSYAVVVRENSTSNWKSVDYTPDGWDSSIFPIFSDKEGAEHFAKIVISKKPDWILSGREIKIMEVKITSVEE